MALAFTGKMGDMKVAMVDDDEVALAIGPEDAVVGAGVCIEVGIGYTSVLLTGRGEGEPIDSLCPCSCCACT